MDFVLLVLSLALAGTCSGVWLWLRADEAATRLKRENARLETRLGRQTQGLRRSLSTAEAEVERLTAAVRTRGEVMQALGRELRTPLTTILGFTQLLRLNDQTDPLSTRQDQAVGQIEAAGGVLLALIEETDAFMTCEDGGGAQATHRVDLRLALRQVCDGLQSHARDAGVALACPPAAHGLCVMADAGQVRRLLRRLVENALRHSSRGGTVRMELSRIDDDIRLAIHDAKSGPQGQGAERLFRPLDGRDARGGTGLGVASAQRLAERMGGTLAMQHDPSGGAVFSLNVPAAPSPGVTPVVALSKPAVALYIEDSAANIALMRQVARGLGLTLHAATTGAEGLDLARALRPDVILLDIGLPDMDGYEVKARLDVDPLTRHVPVLALTAAASPRDSARGRAAGFDAWLAKPLDLAALGAALNDVLDDGSACPGLDDEGRQRA